MQLGEADCSYCWHVAIMSHTLGSIGMSHSRPKYDMSTTVQLLLCLPHILQSFHG